MAYIVTQTLITPSGVLASTLLRSSPAVVTVEIMHLNDADAHLGSRCSTMNGKDAHPVCTLDVNPSLAIAAWRSSVSVADNIKVRTAHWDENSWTSDRNQISTSSLPS